MSACVQVTTSIAVVLDAWEMMLQKSRSFKHEFKNYGSFWNLWEQLKGVTRLLKIGDGEALEISNGDQFGSCP